ncbi:two-component system sensor histidine kinase/response regulator, hybrid ('one-component system') [Pedobacter sp. BAL39]|uniref:two-component regulator propeller domain-containing protein n=1 Tax=Pedobacter sp. BAL39 TaxID=391596 RepID=UPI000155A90E|nr:two-component regulator propeller domain-containing protein [Pedobacter sp. BAL39]EDM34405.1 two-component system sensor histidine kinase/response regulator, hybrid ('one-component system') [Pedobacter sp. BAL39]
MRITHLILFKICFFLTITVCAQPTNLKFRQIGTSQGLSNSVVQTIFQDHHGFMWFGTRDGLNKYDGYHFSTYRRSASSKNTISSNDVKGIVEDKLHHLWVATAGGGLNMLDMEKERFLSPRELLPKNLQVSTSIQYLYKDKKDNLWICSSSKGLYVYNKSTGYYKHYGTIGAIACVTEDDKGNIWVGTSNSGLFIISPSGAIVRQFSVANGSGKGLSDDHLRFIFQDSKKRIWLGTYGGGLHLFDATTQGFRRINFEKTGSDQTIHNFLLCMEEDLKGNLWIGTENGGLAIYNPSSQQSIAYRHIDNDFTSIGSNSINCIKRDAKGNIWLGTTNAGISMVSADESNFVHYKYEQTKNSLSNNIVNTIFEDAAHRIWIGTDGGGLNLFNPADGKFKHFLHQSGKAGICGNFVLSINEDRNHNLWLGTWGDGISIFNYEQQSWKHLKNDPSDPNSLSSNYAFSIFRDSKNRMWVGTYGAGLNLYNEDSGTFNRFINRRTDPKSISSNHILTIHEDDAGTIWVGTDGGGLNKFNERDRNFTAYTPTSGHYQKNSKKLSNESVTSIWDDKDGKLWIGTNYGLNVFDPYHLTNEVLLSDNGLSNDAIGAVIGDGRGAVWISTNKGLSKYNLKTKTFENFSTADGLQADEFKYAKCIDHTGQIYFGGRNGFNVFNPAKISPLNYDPPILFTRFQLFNEDVNVAGDEDDPSPLKAAISEVKQIVLSYKQSSFSFEFASLNYTSDEHKQYQYKLEGLDGEWHKLQRLNKLTYTNLDPGTYTLSIRGLKNNKEWSDRTASIELIITPPFWKTWWFMGLLLLMISGLVLGIFYLRLSEVKKRNRQLKQEVEMRTMELSESNSFLLESNEKIKLQNENLEEVNKEIVRKTDKILNQQKQILVQNEQLESAVKALESSNQTKDRFFSILAHDLKNPISALTGLADLLKNRLNMLGPSEITSYVYDISRSTHSVNTLVMNLLDWARTQSAELHYQPSYISLHELVAKNIYLAQIQLNNKNIHCRIDIDSKHVIYADYQMINTVIRNIIGNSIKFTPVAGEIEISSFYTAEQITISICDNGVGMSGMQLEQLENQQPMPSLGTAGETGTGLGLQICRDFIKRNQGQLKIESLPGRGSSVIITLPGASELSASALKDSALPFMSSLYTDETANEEAAEELFPPQQKQLLKGKRILIVDDNREIRNYLKILLSGTFEIFEAEDGRDGIQKATENQPDLIITDLIMPVMDGLEFCHRTKNNLLTSHVPVLMLTGESNQESQISSYESGADIYINKPINNKILLRVIYNLIHNRENVKRKYTVSEELIPENLDYNKLDREFLERMSVFIEAHLSQADLDYKKLSEHAAMSRTVLYSKFKMLTGMGVHDFIKNIRLKAALKHLQEGKLNISQIAYEVGFSTPSYFSKSFSKQYGLTPKEYVASLKQNAVDIRGLAE